MTEFVASNGNKIRHNTTGLFVEGSSINDGDRLFPSQVVALREFFQSERDTELGRWRSKEHPEYVAYLAPECTDYDLRIICETSGDSMVYTRSEDDGSKRDHPWESTWARVARAYFAAHPEPKPWQAAKVGEHWQIDVGGKDHEVSVVRDDFDNGEEFICSELRCSIFYTGILAGRRIWPES